MAYRTKKTVRKLIIPKITLTDEHGNVGKVVIDGEPGSRVRHHAEKRGASTSDQHEPARKGCNTL